MGTIDPPGAVLDVNLTAIAANYALLRRRHPSGPVAGVVKADGYGLGAEPLARLLYGEGCRHFFVAHLAEALPLAPLLPGAMVAVLNGLAPNFHDAALFAAHDLVPVLNDLRSVEAWSAQARQQGRRLPACLHIDTGMARLGLDAAALTRLVADPAPLAAFDLRYIITHFVSADCAEDPRNAAQAAAARAACGRLRPAPLSLANSSGLFLGPLAASDLARPGAALAGINPTPGRPNPLRPVLGLTAPVLQLREIGAGETVGYNAAWTAPAAARIATVAIGYADGLHRTLSNRGAAYFDGIRLPLVGRVSMDLTTFDATAAPRLAPGDRIALIGPDQDADALATCAGTNAYELLTALSPRVRRRYHR